MTHLTDDQLNEALDKTIFDNSILGHLDTCAECQARLKDLRAVFTALESANEIQLSRDLTSSVMAKLTPSWGGILSRFTRTWKWLSLAQAIGAVAILAWLASSFILPPEVATYQPPTFDTLLASTLQLFSSFTFAAPTFEFQSSTIDLQSTTILTFIVSAAILWLVGNGLLLRSPLRDSRK
ncbi:MAG: hypothetical protein HFACDABA_00497 [Anaerolineales bacterium]|nr:hypothetical protein [Anaerolineales bacterium]